MNLLDYIPTIADFPKPGIAFKDVSPLLADQAAFSHAIDALHQAAQAFEHDCLLAIESRGFVFGAALACISGKSLVLARKPGKLPGSVLSETYGLEYGADRLEVQQHRIPPGARVLLIDDVLATGGTLVAAANLVRRSGAVPAAALVVLEIIALEGARVLSAAALTHQSLLRV